MDFNNLSLGMGLLLSLFSMVVVFIVLLAITYLVDGTAFLLKIKDKKEDRTKIENQGDEKTRAAEQAIQPQLAALVAAAVSAYAGEDTHFVIRRIKRQEPGLSGWESAGLQDGFRRPQ
ncbi:MAG: OadG family protein [Clostridiaceae bacterium]|nr:OadG family protein [Clostridiaceae bacterium]